MVSTIPSPQTLVKVGRYDHSLEDAVKKLSEPLMHVTVGLGNTIKYATFREGERPYLLIVSQQRDRLVSAAGYNLILTTTSYSNSRNHYVADQFQRETGIDLGITVPEQLLQQFSLMGLSFLAFEKNPQAVMAIFRGKF